MRAKVVCRLKKYTKYVSFIQSDYHRCFYTAANHCNQYEATPLAPTSAPCLLLLHSSLGNGMMTIYTLLIYFFVAPP